MAPGKRPGGGGYRHFDTLLCDGHVATGHPIPACRAASWTERTSWLMRHCPRISLHQKSWCKHEKDSLFLHRFFPLRTHQCVFTCLGTEYLSKQQKCWKNGTFDDTRWRCLFPPWVPSAKPKCWVKCKQTFPLKWHVCLFQAMCKGTQCSVCCPSTCTRRRSTSSSGSGWSSWPPCPSSTWSHGSSGSSWRPTASSTWRWEEHGQKSFAFLLVFLNILWKKNGCSTMGDCLGWRKKDWTKPVKKKTLVEGEKNKSKTESGCSTMGDCGNSLWGEVKRFRTKPVKKTLLVGRK